MTTAPHTKIAVITTVHFDNKGKHSKTELVTVKAPTRRPRHLDGLKALARRKNLKGFFVHTEVSPVWDHEEQEFLLRAEICDANGRPVVDMGYDYMGGQEVLAYFIHNN